ncbi:MAG: carbohydrate kinase family protein [Lawsonibacter sp.]|jgi:fructokinase
MYDIISMGEILIDLTQTEVNPQGICLFAAHPGGAPANVAVAAARLGAKCAFWGKVGQDGLGDLLLQTLRANNVSASGVRRGVQATSMAVVTLSPSGERSFRFLRGADQELSVAELEESALEHTKFFHFGSVSLTAGPSRTATIFAARQARTHGVLISYDPNYRPSLWPDPESALQWMAIPLPMVDLLKLSEEELPLLSHCSDLEEGSSKLASLGPRLILVTLGERGVFYRWGTHTGTVPGVPVSVVDTNGAGDTFLGATLYALTRRPAGPLTDLTIPELESILALANRAAAFTCSRSGAIPAMPLQQDLFPDHTP